MSDPKAPKQRGRKKKSEKFDDFNVDKMLEERRHFYEGLKEIEAKKKNFEQKYSEEEYVEVKPSSDNEVLSALKLTENRSPKVTIFDENLRYQCFTLESIKKKLPADMPFNYLIGMLDNGTDINHQISNQLLRQLLYIMSIHDEDTVIDSCYTALTSNVTRWKPKFRQIIRILLNWGASMESLGIYQKFVFTVKNNRESSRHWLLPSEMFTEYNYEKVFNYLHLLFKEATAFLDTGEKVTVLKCLTKIMLEDLPHKVFFAIKNCIALCVESLSSWNEFQIVTISRLLHDRKDHFHAQVYMLTNCLPKIDRCDNLCTCLSYAICCSLVGEKKKPMYIFPVENEDILDTIRGLKINPDSEEDLYRVYILVQLINYIVFQRAVPVTNKDFVQDLQRLMNNLKLQVDRSKRTFDATCVKGRILYCCAMWTLAVPKNQRGIQE